MDKQTIDAYFAIFKQFDHLWRSYSIKPKGMAIAELFNGGCIFAKSPDELRKAFAEIASNR